MADFAVNEIGDFCLDVLMAYQLGLPGVSRVCAFVCVCPQEFIPHPTFLFQLLLWHTTYDMTRVFLVESCLLGVHILITLYHACSHHSLLSKYQQGLFLCACIFVCIHSPFPKRWNLKWSSEWKSEWKSESGKHRSRSLCVWKFEKRSRTMFSWFRFPFRFPFRRPFQVSSFQERAVNIHLSSRAIRKRVYRYIHLYTYLLFYIYCDVYM